MKKVLMLLLVTLVAITAISASPDNSVVPEKLTGKLNVAYAYKKDLYYRFIFSDSRGSRDGSFEDLFNTPGLDWIKMSTLDNGRLKNDTSVYVNWMVDELTPIEKLTLEVPGPLVSSSNDVLDWFVSIENQTVIGGRNGYGPSSSVTVYERNLSMPLVPMVDSVQLSLYTEDVTGRKAGDYVGSIVLRVYGGI